MSEVARLIRVQLAEMSGESLPVPAKGGAFVASVDVDALKWESVSDDVGIILVGYAVSCEVQPDGNDSFEMYSAEATFRLTYNWTNGKGDVSLRDFAIHQALRDAWPHWANWANQVANSMLLRTVVMPAEFPKMLVEQGFSVFDVDPFNERICE